MQAKNRTLVIYFPSLASGGAERIHIGLCSAFIEAGWDVTFLLQRAEGAFLQSVPKEARVVSLDSSRTLTSFVPLVRFLRKEKPDILLSNIGHNNILAIWAAALARVPTRVIVTLHNTLSQEYTESEPWQYRLLPFLYRTFLKRARGIICVSQGVADDLMQVTGLESDRIRIISNPVIFSDFDDRMRRPATHRWLTPKRSPVVLAVGRLHEQKDFMTLLSAFAVVAAKRDVKLILLGEGAMHEQLAAHASALGIVDSMDIPGFVENPLPFMRAADLLVMSSRYEGFGNVLVEALACGTPVVSTDCPHGPSEILDKGKFGRLVPVGDKDAMADAILQTLDNRPATEFLQQRGREFTAERAVKLYLGLFETTLSS